MEFPSWLEVIADNLTRKVIIDKRVTLPSGMKEDELGKYVLAQERYPGSTSFPVLVLKDTSEYKDL